MNDRARNSKKTFHHTTAVNGLSLIPKREEGWAEEAAITTEYFRLLKLLLLFLTLCSAFLPAAGLAQGTAFTYQGALQSGGSPASGTYNFTFTLFSLPTGGTAVAGPIATNGVAVSNGLFAVTLDFGAAVWNSETNWLEIDVESNTAASFTKLAPRQQLTPAPCAILRRLAEPWRAARPSARVRAISLLAA